MRPMYYILHGHKVLPANDVLEWAYWMAAAHKNGLHVVKFEFVCAHVQVSTIFTGVDYGYLGAIKPLVFETMVLGGTEDGYRERYSTWAGAEGGHERLVKKLKAGQPLLK